MSIDSILLEKQQELRIINQNFKEICSLITPTNLAHDDKLRQQFYYQQEQPVQQDEDESLQSLSLAQLNNKHETIQRIIHEIKRLVELNTNISEITQLLNKPKQISDLLDLQQLHNLFQSTSIPNSSSLVIYSELSRLFDNQKAQFIQQLNDYLVLLIPDQHHIENSALLNDFNSFLVKHGYVLDQYITYRKYWDEIIDVILDQPKQLELEEDDLRISINIVDSNQPNWLKSMESFIKFINELNNLSIKQYMNSKLSKLLIDKISTNINDVNINCLNDLIQLCKETGWNILASLSGSLEENLNKLHQDWIIDNYIEKIRQVYLCENIEDLESVDNIEEIPQQQDIVEENPQEHKEETIEEEETDGWNDNWDDGWDDDDYDNNNSDPIQEEDDWNDKWDDNWDDESDKEVAPVYKSPQRKTTTDKPLKQVVVSGKMLISPIPIKVINIFNEFQLDTKYLVSIIKALSLVIYPPLTNSFLMLNDLNYLFNKLDLPLQPFIQTNWNQVLITFYSEIKNIVSLIDLSEEETNNNSLDLLHKWFKHLDKQLYTSNPYKFKLLISDIIEFINNWLINAIIELSDISEFQCTKTTDIIDTINDITTSYINQFNIKTLPSYNKLNNVRFLINNHLSAILGRFYQGELYDLTTDEIINLIKGVFIQSELRDNTINEIIEFRNMN